MNKLIFPILLIMATAGCNSLKKDFGHPEGDKPVDHSKDPVVEQFFGSSTGPATVSVKTVFPALEVTVYYSQDYHQGNFRCYPLGTSDTEIRQTPNSNGQPYATVVRQDQTHFTVAFGNVQAGQDFCYDVKSDPLVDAAASKELY